MDNLSLEMLDFFGVLDLVAAYARTPQGRCRLKDLRPTTDAGELTERYHQIREASVLLAEDGLSFDLPEPWEMLDQLRVSAASLSPEALLTVQTYLDFGERVRQAIHPERYPHLGVLIGRLPLPSPLAARIGTVLDPQGRVRETAHPDLPRLRRRLERAKGEIHTLLQGVLEGRLRHCLIDQPYITQRAGRYVVPVKIEHQKEIPGLVQGVSSSGATVFLEPLAAIELNNELIYCQEQENAIIQQLLLELSLEARRQQPLIQGVVDLSAHLDALSSCLLYGDTYDCTLLEPRSDPDQAFVLYQARHPLLQAKLGRSKVVPIDIRLDAGTRALVVSGPNAGGKTAALKTAGLLACLAHAAVPVPAAQGELPLLAGVFADIGDLQSITEQVSTFSSHVRRLQQVLDSAPIPSLVLVDEPGRGTDPAHGAALALAFLEALLARKHFLLVTTHHRRIKVWAGQRRGVTNAAVLLDSSSSRPTYQLHYGVSADSSGFEIARQLDVDQGILNRARELLEPQEREIELFLRELREKSAELAEQAAHYRRLQQALEEEKQQFSRKEQEWIREAERRLDHLLKNLEKEYGRQAEALFDRLQHRLESEERRRQVRMELHQRRAQLRQRLRQEVVEALPGRSEGEPAVEAGPISIGDEAIHQALGARGRVIGFDQDWAILEGGGKRWRVKRLELRKIERTSVVEHPTPGVSAHIVKDTEPQLNLVGKTLTEAADLLDKFVDRAFLSGLDEIEIIHGFGTGRLKAFVESFLSKHTHVESCSVEGGTTRARLKQ